MCHSIVLSRCLKIQHLVRNCAIFLDESIVQFNNYRLTPTLYQYYHPKQVQSQMKIKYAQNTSSLQPATRQALPQHRSKKIIQLNLPHQNVAKIRMDFKYSFQDFLKMALCKLIPHEGIIVDVKQGFIYGEKDLCVKLKKKVQKEFASKRYKKIQFKKQVDLDEIQYELHPKFQAHIFRPGYINRALTSLALYDSFESPTHKFKEVINKGKTIILRLKADFQCQCIEKLEQILKRSYQSTQQNKQKAPKYPTHNKKRTSMEDEDYEQVVDETENYYQIKYQSSKQKEQKMLQQLNESHITIGEESQFNLTMTNSSFLMDQENQMPITDCQISYGL